MKAIYILAGYFHSIP